MNLEEFRDVVVEALGEVPGGLQPYLDGFEFDVADSPPPTDAGRRSSEERIELSAGGRYGLAALRRVTLYRAPFEAAAAYSSDLRELVRDEVVRRLTSPPDDGDDSDGDDDEAT